MPTNPFALSFSAPGEGTIHLSLLPPSTPVLQTLSYQYPLKLIAPAAIHLPYFTSISNATTNSSSTHPQITHLIHTIFLLTYGGGLVAGDTINLRITLAPTTRLILLTQGSTKIFKSPSSSIFTSQNTTVSIGNGAALCYLPEPVQPFEASAFEQRQVYMMEGKEGNICVCDWVSEGRTARGERWKFRRYISRNEVWLLPGDWNGDMHGDGKRRLLLRDNMLLDAENERNDKSITMRMDGLGVYGTLILGGPLFRLLGMYFMKEFKLLPQIGARQWDPLGELSTEEIRRAARVEREKVDGVLWSAAALRTFTVVKFGAKEVEGAKTWLRTMLRSEGTVEREFGERALLCLK